MCFRISEKTFMCVVITFKLGNVVRGDYISDFLSSERFVYLGIPCR